ncbi:Cell division protein FtsZ 1 [Candidatus Gugararchaeum adminiculabundum]|nr:Cell division protein FtsZ 1 [Candidatus Gugararchaeum adminiculabundum]
MEDSVISGAKPPEKQDEFKGPKIMVCGVGGAGCNTINRLARLGVGGAQMMAVNTDKKHLDIISDSAVRVLIGASLTRGLGAGGFPDIGKRAAEASRKDLEQLLDGVDLLFLCGGMGGGTGTGAAPIIAEVAKKSGAIVVSMVTYPFALERARKKKADDGISALRQASDTVVVIDNNRLVHFVPNLPIDQAFNIADEVTSRAVRGITETILLPSLMNLDYSDVRSIMTNGGISMISVGEGNGVGRVDQVARTTLDHKLLDVDTYGAKGVLLHLTGGKDMTIGEANEIGEQITQEVDPKANVIWGARLDPRFAGKIESIAIFTGVKTPYTLGTAGGKGMAFDSL